MRSSYESSVLIVLLLSLSLGIGAAYGAAEFPEKPITIVVHTTPGTGTDMIARMAGQVFQKYKLLPQPLVVENKPGGSASVALSYVAGRKKDPYCLMAATTLLILTPLQVTVPVSYKDFTPICNFCFDDNTIMVNSNSKYKSVKDLVADAKANPQKVSVGVSSLGATSSLNAYLFEKEAGIKLNYIVLGGGGEILTALLGGHIDLALSQPVETLELVKGNKARLLGVFSEKRLPGISDIPTLREQGINVTGLQMNRGMIAPAGIPENARKILEEAFFKFSKTEEYRKFIVDSLVTEAWMDGSAYGKWMVEKNNSATALLKEMGLLKKKN